MTNARPPLGAVVLASIMLAVGTYVLVFWTVPAWVDRIAYVRAAPCGAVDSGGCVREVSAEVTDTSDDEYGRVPEYVVSLRSAGAFGGEPYDSAVFEGRRPEFFDHLSEGSVVRVRTFDTRPVWVELPGYRGAHAERGPYVRAARKSVEALVPIGFGAALLLLALTGGRGRLARSLLPLCAATAAIWVPVQHFGVYDGASLAATFLAVAVGAALLMELEVRRTVRAAVPPMSYAARPTTP